MKSTHLTGGYDLGESLKNRCFKLVSEMILSRLLADINSRQLTKSHSLYQMNFFN